ncbi:MAG: hypothetical protein NW237_05995 [Cyanobacteriota bacterium]|nr:hypothetical protein [Cyanobacteriota bacterium]
MRICQRSGDSGERGYCATCGRLLTSQRCHYHLLNDQGIDLGAICNLCRTAEPSQLRQRIRRYAYLLRLNLSQSGLPPDLPPSYPQQLDNLLKEKHIHYPGLWGWWRSWRQSHR